MRFEVLKINIVVFWVTILCSFVGGCQCFRMTFFSLVYPEDAVPSKCGKHL
jgi:hypothetical protein